MCDSNPKMLTLELGMQWSPACSSSLLAHSTARWSSLMPLMGCQLGTQSPVLHQCCVKHLKCSLATDCQADNAHDVSWYRVVCQVKKCRDLLQLQRITGCQADSWQLSCDADRLQQVRKHLLLGFRAMLFQHMQHLLSNCKSACCIMQIQKHLTLQKFKGEDCRQQR